MEILFSKNRISREYTFEYEKTPLQNRISRVCTMEKHSHIKIEHMEVQVALTDQISKVHYHLISYAHEESRL